MSWVPFALMFARMFTCKHVYGVGKDGILRCKKCGIRKEVK